MNNLLPDWCFQQQKLLSEQIANDNLPHAILISGYQGSGKLALANWLINSLICQNKTQDSQGNLYRCNQCKTCLLVDSQTFPDSKTVSAQTTTISVEDIRGVSQFIEKKSHIGTHKTVLIEDADKMTVSAANALLKTLEEPTENTLIVLTCAQVDRLLPTIISRCRLIELRANKQKDIKNPFANITQQAELNDAKLAQAYAEFEQYFFSFLINPSLKKPLFDACNNQEHALLWLERLLANLLREQHNWPTQLQSSDENIGQNVVNSGENLLKDVQLAINSDKIWQLYKILLVANKSIVDIIQVNRALFVEQLLIKFERCISQ